MAKFRIRPNPTDEKEVEYGAEDSIEDDGPEVAHEDPVVEGVGGLCQTYQHNLSSREAGPLYTVRKESEFSEKDY
jgi:hypothetical protein